jgi:heptosyltransferase II
MFKKMARLIVLLICGICWLITRVFLFRLSRINPAKEPVDRIVVLAWGGIGNVILLTPVLNNLRRNFPLAQICVVVNPNGSKQALEGSQWADVIIEQQDKGLKDIFKNAQEAKVKNKTGLFLCMAGIDPIRATFYSFFCGCKYRVGERGRLEGFLYTHTTKVEPHKHEVERDLDLLRAIGVPVKDKDISFFVPEEIKAEIHRELANKGVGNDLIVMSPSSGITQSFKRWPKEHFAQVATWFIKRGFRVFLLGSSDEWQLCEDIRRMSADSVQNTAGQWSLKQAAAAISFSRMVLTNDNVFMHVAAALKIPVVAIFGPTLPEKNSPWASSYRIVKNTLECSPCFNFQKFFCPNDLRCLKELSPSVVIAAIEEFDRQIKCLS